MQDKQRQAIRDHLKSIQGKDRDRLFSVTKKERWKLKNLNTEVMLAIIGHTDGMQFDAICRTFLPKDVQEAINLDPSKTPVFRHYYLDLRNNALVLMKAKIKQLIKLGLLKEVKGRDRIVYQLTDLGKESNTYECMKDPSDPLKNQVYLYKLIMDTEYKYTPVQPVGEFSLSIVGRVLSPLAIHKHIQAYLEHYDKLDPVVRGVIFGHIQAEMRAARFISSHDVVDSLKLLTAGKSQ